MPPQSQPSAKDTESPIAYAVAHHEMEEFKKEFPALDKKVSFYLAGLWVQAMNTDTCEVIATFSKHAPSDLGLQNAVNFLQQGYKVPPRTPQDTLWGDIKGTALRLKQHADRVSLENKFPGIFFITVVRPLNISDIKVGMLADFRVSSATPLGVLQCDGIERYSPDRYRGTLTNFLEARKHARVVMALKVLACIIIFGLGISWLSRGSSGSQTAEERQALEDQAVLAQYGKAHFATYVQSRELAYKVGLALLLTEAGPFIHGAWVRPENPDEIMVMIKKSEWKKLNLRKRVVLAGIIWATFAGVTRETTHALRLVDWTGKQIGIFDGVKLLED